MFLLAGVLYLAIITATGKVITFLDRRVRLP
jgi:polar amino acid transport system permease protein